MSQPIHNKRIDSPTSYANAIVLVLGTRWPQRSALFALPDDEILLVQHWTLSQRSGRPYAKYDRITDWVSRFSMARCETPAAAAPRWIDSDMPLAFVGRQFVGRARRAVRLTGSNSVYSPRGGGQLPTIRIWITSAARRCRSVSNCRYPASHLLYRTTSLPKVINLDASVDPTAKLFGERLRQLRISHRMTQAQISENTGITPAYVSLIERGKANPTLDMMVKLTDTVGSNIWDMIRPEGHFPS